MRYYVKNRCKKNGFFTPIGFAYFDSGANGFPEWIDDPASGVRFKRGEARFLRSVLRSAGYNAYIIPVFLDKLIQAVIAYIARRKESQWR